MLTDPLISVIIPAYNSARFIDETIESVVNQTYTNLEIIVIDDGSTDNQKDHIMKWCDRDKRVGYFYQDNNGVSSARNNGFARSKGDFVAFLDSDDVWLSDNLSSKLEKFNEGNFGLVHSDGLVIDENSKTSDQIMAGKEGMLINDMLAWRGTQIPGPSSILVKREVIEKTGLFDTRLSTSADQDFFFRVASNYKIGRVNKVSWYYRVHSFNMHKNIAMMEKDVLYVYKKAERSHLFPSYWFKQYCFASMYLILSYSWAGDGKNFSKGIYFGLKSLIAHPIFFFSKVIERLKR